jgi:hypothetical protein
MVVGLPLTPQLSLFLPSISLSMGLLAKRGRGIESHESIIPKIVENEN